jgi:hypothetical protein
MLSASFGIYSLLVGPPWPNEERDLPVLCTKCQVIPNKCMYCARCMGVVYCNKECQHSDWKQHKPKCSKLIEMKDLLVANATRVSVSGSGKSCFMAQDIEYTDTKIIVAWYASLHQLKLDHDKQELLLQQVTVSGLGEKCWREAIQRFTLLPDFDPTSQCILLQIILGIPNYMVCLLNCKKSRYGGNRFTTFKPCSVCEEIMTDRKRLTCTGCNAVAYCSTVCQKYAWKDGHKSECKKNTR